MKKIYKDPKELATCLKDLIDLYLDDVINYDKLKTKMTIFIKANENRLYKDGKISSKISFILGTVRVEVINKIFLQIQN